MSKAKNIGLAMICSVLCSAIGFYIGKTKGQREGYTLAATRYDSWASSLMFRDPDVRMDAIMLVPDGARISQPKCRDDEYAYMRLSRRPEIKWSDEAKIETMQGDWIAVVPPQDSVSEVRAAALVGCRKLEKHSKRVTDLTKSWELPSTIQ